MSQGHQQSVLEKCLVREHFGSIWTRLEDCSEDRFNPGFYLAGASGCGKSSTMFLLTKRARETGWLVLYVVFSETVASSHVFHQPRCDAWCNKNPAEACCTFLAAVQGGIGTSGFAMPPAQPPLPAL